MTQPEWFEAVKRLCTNGYDPDHHATGGAQVQVFNRDTGEMVYRQPIAREVRLEPHEPLLWWRQIIGEGPQFDPNESRRRSFFTTDATVTADRVTFPQPQAETREYGVILPADPDQLAAIEAWDSWKLLYLTAQQESELEALAE